MRPAEGGKLIGPGSAVTRGRRGWFPSPVDAVVRSDGRLDHYRRLRDRPDRPWLRLGTVTEAAVAPGALAWRSGDLVAIVPEADGPVEYWLTPSGWQRIASLARSGRSPGSDPRPGTNWSRPVPPGLHEQLTAARLQVTAIAGHGGGALVEEAGSLFGYHLVGSRWERDSCLRIADPEPFDVSGPESVKLAQVSGEVDATPTPWGERLPTLSASLSTAGIRGTDLGVRVDHAGRSFLLFGDTHWTRRWLTTRDAIAEVTVPGPRPGLPGVRFHGSPLKPFGLGVTRREYDVPLDGFSAGGQLYAFFSSNHFRSRRVMGRSVIARADTNLVIDPAVRRRPIRFRVLATFSERHFLTVSAQVRPASAVPGCGPDGDVVLIWGSGPYRASEARLALLDQAALARLDAVSRPIPTAELGVRYFNGTGWSDAEDDAAPLFGPAALGELCVRWVPAVGRYLLLAASGPEDPMGHAITLRTASRPEGPWSPRRRLLDWVATGMTEANTRFIKAATDDIVGDRIFPGQARGTGAAYAPYLFDAVAEGDEVILRYLLSTWNPYQVVLMRHRLPLASL